MIKGFQSEGKASRTFIDTCKFVIISIKRFKASAQKSCNSSHRYPLMHILLGLLNLQGNCTIASHHWTTTLQTVKQWCEKDVNGKWLIQRLSTLSWQQAKTKENIKLHVQLWTALLNSCTFFYFLLQVRGCQSNFILFFQNKLSVQILNLHLHTLKQLTYSIHLHKSTSFHLNMQKFSPFSF